MKLPPYGKSLNDFLSAGHSFKDDFVYIYIGDKAWEMGKSSYSIRPFQTLILPPQSLAIAYLWPVHNCDILIVETTSVPEKYMENIVLTLFSYKAKTIISFSFTDKSNTFYEKDF